MNIFYSWEVQEAEATVTMNTFRTLEAAERYLETHDPAEVYRAIQIHIEETTTRENIEQWVRDYAQRLKIEVEAEEARDAEEAGRRLAIHERARSLREFEPETAIAV